MLQNPEKHRNYHENRHQFLGQMCQNTEKVRELARKIDVTSWAGCGRTPKSTRITTKNEHGRSWTAKKGKNTSFIMKTALKNIPEQRKVRELPRKTNIEEVQEPKKYENYHAKPDSDPFKSTAEHRKYELPRKMNMETTKIHIQNPFTLAAATRNYENSHTKRTCKHEST